jgi:5-(hydroxymethyl)furfural/furfural oxidase
MDRCRCRGLELDRTSCPITANWKTISIATKAKPRAGLIPSAVCRGANGRDLCQAIEQAAVERGLPLVEDINEKPGEGFFPMPLSQDMTTRASSAHAYLTEAVRRRPNLRIMADACVTALQFDGLRAKGASVDHAGKTVEIAAREIVLCAGAIHSPTILLRAGIGPADELQKIGITPRLDRAGVGRNLQNHPYLHFALTLPRQSRLQNTLRRFAIAGARAILETALEPHRRTCCCSRSAVSAHAITVRMLRWSGARFTHHTRAVRFRW